MTDQPPPPSEHHARSDAGGWMIRHHDLLPGRSLSTGGCCRPIAAELADVTRPGRSRTHSGGSSIELTGAAGHAAYRPLLTIRVMRAMPKLYEASPTLPGGGSRYAVRLMGDATCTGPPHSPNCPACSPSMSGTKHVTVAAATAYNGRPASSPLRRSPAAGA